MNTSTRDGLAEVLLFPGGRRHDADAERLAEVDAEIREHFERIHDLLGERLKLERGEAA